MRQLKIFYIAAYCAAIPLFMAFAVNAQSANSAESPAAKVFSAWLAAFNSADVTQFSAFDNIYKPNPPMAGDVEFRKMTGGFTLVRVEVSEATRFIALLKEKASENMGRIELTVSTTEPPTVLGLEIRLVPAQPPPSASTGSAEPIIRLSQEALLSVTNKRIDELAAAEQFSGAVLIAQNGKAWLTRAVGMENRDKNIPNTQATKFRIGSMNKMFTAIATLQLVAHGKLSLDDTVGKHLPDYPNSTIANKATIRQLLTHSGGTGDIFGPEFEQQRLTLKTPSDYIKLYGNRAPLFEPDTNSRYSNFGYVLLGAMIEKVSGQTYDDYVQKQIFAVAGMLDTGALPESQLVLHRAVGYMRPQGKLVPNDPTLPWSGSPAGGGYSTVGDMLRFALALESGKLISKAMLADATAAKQKSYGFGFGVRGNADWKGFGHGGGAPGINGELRIIPDHGYVVVVLSNFDPPAAEQLVSFITARLPASKTSVATTVQRN